MEKKETKRKLFISLPKKESLSSIYDVRRNSEVVDDSDSRLLPPNEPELCHQLIFRLKLLHVSLTLNNQIWFIFLDIHAIKI